MSFFIHTPSFSMSVGILTTWGAGCSCIAGNIYSRYFVGTSIASTTVQFWIRLIVVIFGIMLFPKIKFLQFSWIELLPEVIIGFIGGMAIIKFELWNERKYSEKLSQFKQGKKVDILKKDLGEIEKFTLGLCSNKQKVANWKDKSLCYIYDIKNKNEFYSLPILLGIAFLEECIFRGYLLTFCFFLPTNLVYPAILFLTLVFGAKHVHARSREFLAKFFLGLVTTIETIYFGNIIAAIITHGYLNYYVYKQNKMGMS